MEPAPAQPGEPTKRATLADSFLRAVKIFGAFCFLAPTAIVLAALGFQPDYVHDASPKHLLPPTLMWSLSCGFGALGGICLNPRRYVIAGLSGLVSAVVVVATSLLYFSWREHLSTIEILLPALVGGFAGGFLYAFLERRTRQ